MNLELREHDKRECTCKSLQPIPVTPLQQFYNLLVDVPEAFDPSVERLNLGMLRDIYREAQIVIAIHQELSYELELINSLANKLKNGLIDRTTFIKNINDVQAKIEMAVEREIKREILLADLSTELSGWTLEQLEAFEALCKTLHRA